MNTIANTARRRVVRRAIPSTETTPYLSFLYPVLNRGIGTKPFSRKRPAREQLSSKWDYDDDLDDIPMQMSSFAAQPAPEPVEEADPWAYLTGAVDPPKPPKPTFDFRSNTQASSSSSSSCSSTYTPISYPRNASRPSYTPNTSTKPDVGDLTISEYAVFEKIFSELLKTRSGPPPIQPNRHPRSSSRKREYQPGPTLSALFESALGPQLYNDSDLSFGPERVSHNPNDVTAALSRASGSSSFPPSLRAAAAHVAGLPRAEMSPSELAAEETRQTELKALLQKLDECDTDLEVSEFLENHVYSYARPIGDEPESGFNIPSANYPDLLAAVMQHLRVYYKSYPSIVSVFETVKRLGAESYVVGCSVAVYNEVIRARWQGYRDLAKVAELLEEMRINGIQGDVETWKVVEGVVADVGVLRVADMRRTGARIIWGEEEVEWRVQGLREVLRDEGGVIGMRGAI